MLGIGLCVLLPDSILRFSARFILSTSECRRLKEQASGCAFFNRGDLSLLDRYHCISLPLIRLQHLLPQT